MRFPGQKKVNFTETFRKNKENRDKNNQFTMNNMPNFAV